MDLSQKINFLNFFACIQPCVEMKEKMENYFDFCFIDLLNRNSTIEHDGKISNVTMAGYLKLPLIICNKLINLFSSNDSSKKKSIDKKEFKDIMMNFYFGSLETLQFITFKLFDLCDNEYVAPENINIVISYLCSTYSLPILEGLDLNKMISKFFNSEEELSFVKYKSIIDNYNSNIFYLILILIYKQQPFSEEDLNFYAQNSNLKNISPSKNETESYFYNYKCNLMPPSKHLLNHFNSVLNPCRIKRKYGSKNLLDFKNEKNKSPVKNSSGKIKNYPNLIKIKFRSSTLLSNFSSKLISNTLDSAKIIYPNNIESEDNSKNLYKKELNLYAIQNSRQLFQTKLELVAYKSDQNNKIRKHKLIIIDKNIFNFCFFKSKNEFKLVSIHPLNGLYIVECDQLTLVNKPLYIFVFMNRFGNAYTNINNIYFCYNKDQMKNFINNLKIANEIDDFENYYKIAEQFIENNNNNSYNLINGINIKNLEKVSVKLINKKIIKDENLEQLRFEIDKFIYLKNYIHPNIIQIIDVLEDKNFIYIVMEALDNNKLDDFKEKNFKILDIKQIENMLKLICSGLNFLNKHKIKLLYFEQEDLIVNFSGDNLKLKICDLGFSEMKLKTDKVQVVNDSVYEIVYKQTYNLEDNLCIYAAIIFHQKYGYIPFIFNEMFIPEIFNKLCDYELVLSKDEH